MNRAPDDHVDYPPGWLIRRRDPMLVDLVIEDINGRQFGDFCSACALIPASALIGKLMKHHMEKR